MKTMLTAMATLALLAACGTDYDGELLEEFRRAIPQKEDVTARTPQSMAKAMPKQASNPAQFPQFAVPVAKAINRHLGGMIDILRNVVELEPTAYNSETQEFIWGPFDNEDTAQQGDTAYVYVIDHGEDSDEDFRYGYAFLRGMGNDVAAMQPVIWGGTNPDPENEDWGTGVTLWDFEANYEWEEANNPDHGDLTRGRFAAAFHRGAGEDDADIEEILWVVAAFRDFVPDDAGSDKDPINMDYLYGRGTRADDHFDFLDYQFAADMDSTASSAAEDIGMQLAFYNDGIGRAEVDASGGDIATDMPGYYIESQECWNDMLVQTYLNMDAVPIDDASTDPSFNIIEVGDVSNCVMHSLDDAPTLEQIDPEILNALDDVASNGL